MRQIRSRLRTQMAFTLALASAVASASCGQQSTAQENQNSQYNAESQAQYQKLKPAEAVWTGKMHLTQSDQDFDVTLTLHRVWENDRVAGSPDPTATTELPTLKGNLDFVVLDRDDTGSDLSNLLNPMGQFRKVMFDFGNYVDRTQELILPYSVPGYSLGEFGDLSGKIVGNHYQGTWFANAFGQVGTFDLVKVVPQ